MVESAGCVDIFGSRSNASPVVDVAADGALEIAREARGKTVGRRGVSDANVLRTLAALQKMRDSVYLLGEGLNVWFRRACDIVEELDNALRPGEHRRHCIMPLWSSIEYCQSISTSFV
jgi:hypothetical protein